MRGCLAVLAAFILVLGVGCSRNDDAGSVNVPAKAPSVATPEPSAPRTAGDEPVVEDDADDDSSPEDKNTPPEIRRVWFVSGDGTVGNTLGVEFETFDEDGDAVKVDIAWTKNDEPVGSGKFIQAALRRDDKVMVTLTPSDGKAEGRRVTLSRVILNSPPTIEGHEQFQFEGNTLAFQVRASDPDGDTLQYSLKEGPPGMTIDQNTGSINWDVLPEMVGNIPFAVEVSDGAGGSATARFSVTIAPQPASEAK